METNVKGLEKQTKKQLIEIILRKDDVEHRQDETIRNMKKDMDGTIKSYNEINEKYKKLIANNKMEQESSNRLIEQNEQLKKTIKIKSDIIVIESVIFVVVLIAMLLFF